MIGGLEQLSPTPQILPIAWKRKPEMRDWICDFWPGAAGKPKPTACCRSQRPASAAKVLLNPVATRLDDNELSVWVFAGRHRPE
ncbi:MAG: hypothetical protein IID45_01450 [Planctomycetes bacterium]|nr:hypothetical protein [Planctomycetota bacterium]